MTHLIYAQLPKFQGFLGDRPFAFFEGFSKFYGYFAARFFDKEKWMKFIQKLKSTRAIKDPQVCKFPIGFATGSSVHVDMSTKMLLNPINKNFIRGGDIYTKIIFSSKIIWSYIAPQNNTSFSIKNACQINKPFSVSIHKPPTSKSNYNDLMDKEQVNLTVNVVSEETREIVKRYSGLYGNIER